jgi:UrcA family protein
MVASTSKISKLIENSGAPQVNAEVRSAALFWIVSLLVTGVLSFIVCMLGITPAWSSNADPRSVRVSYADLDLSGPAGAQTLYGRIQSAASQVCGNTGASFIERRTWSACYRNAIDDAVRKVNSPMLIAVHTGTPAPVTAMLTK